MVITKFCDWPTLMVAEVGEAEPLNEPASTLIETEAVAEL